MLRRPHLTRAACAPSSRGSQGREGPSEGPPLWTLSGDKDRDKRVLVSAEGTVRTTFSFQTRQATPRGAASPGARNLKADSGLYGVRPATS